MPLQAPDVQPQIFIDIRGPLLLQVVSRPLLRAESPILRAIGIVALLHSFSVLLQAGFLEIARALGQAVIARV